MDAITAPDFEIEEVTDKQLLSIVTTVECILNRWDLTILGSSGHLEFWMSDVVYPECERRGLLQGGKWYTFENGKAERI